MSRKSIFKIKFGAVHQIEKILGQYLKSHLFIFKVQNKKYFCSKFVYFKISNPYRLTGSVGYVSISISKCEVIIEKKTISAISMSR